MHSSSHRLVDTFRRFEGAQVAALTITAVWFTAGHVFCLEDGVLHVVWIRVFDVFPMAVWYTAVRLRSGSLPGPVLAHNAANVFVECVAALRFLNARERSYAPNNLRRMNALFDRLGIEHPIVQAPMAGVSTAELAAGVCNAGGLGSIAIGTLSPAGARDEIVALRARTARAFNVNVFCHIPATRDDTRESAWLERLRPDFERFGGSPPRELREIYGTFAGNGPMLDVLVATAPPVISFHFGLPPSDAIAALKHAGCITFATATNLREAEAAVAAGVDAIVAQGYEAGGHRGVFRPRDVDECLATGSLTRLLARQLDVPIVAAGGIMNGAEIAAMLAAGAVAAQLGTAFIACPESHASDAYRAALARANETGTTMTSAISGRPARCVVNRFTRIGDASADKSIPDYPVAYDAGKALDMAARASGENGYGAHWAGTGVGAIRTMPASALVATLASELEIERDRRGRAAP